AWCRRQTDVICEIDVGDASVMLQELQNLVIDFVEIRLRLVHLRRRRHFAHKNPSCCYLTLIYGRAGDYRTSRMQADCDFGLAWRESRNIIAHECMLGN